MSNETPPSKDRVFLITGASSGIGAATARRAHEEGWRLVLAARSLERLQTLADELGGAERTLAVRCDVSEWGQQQQMVEAALNTFGRLDVAFANAGFGGARGFLKDTPEHWREMVLTNVYGAALTLRATIPALTDSRGHLLLTSSVAGRRALPGSMYSCTKHAVTAMGEAARQDLHGTGIRVTLIEPGMTDTPFFDNRPDGRARGRRHRACGDVCGLPAPACERERDSGAPDRPGGLERVAQGVADAMHARAQACPWTRPIGCERGDARSRSPQRRQRRRVPRCRAPLYGAVHRERGSWQPRQLSQLQRTRPVCMALRDRRASSVSRCQARDRGLQASVRDHPPQGAWRCHPPATWRSAARARPGRPLPRRLAPRQAEMRRAAGRWGAPSVL